jgi:hypothetical protein
VLDQKLTQRVTQVIISHARLFYYFCGMLYLAASLEMVVSQCACPLRITQRVLCGS